MRLKPCLLGLALLVVAPAFGQTIYKCPSATPGAPPVIQQMTCSLQGGGEMMEVKPLKASGAGGLREGEKDMLSKTSPNLMLKTLEKDLVKAQGEADAAKEKADVAQKKADDARRAEQPYRR